VSEYQQHKTNLDFTEARDSEWQWHQLGHMQACTSLQSDNHASTQIFYRLDALSAAQLANQQCQSTEGINFTSDTACYISYDHHSQFFS